MNRFFNKLMARLFTKFPSVAERWVDKNIESSSDESPSEEMVSINRELSRGLPFTKPRKKLSESRIAIITTAGVHLKTDIPFNMEDPNGDETFRVIPSDARKGELMITHDYYDHSDADKDINIVFPIDRLRELTEVGFIGSVAENHFSFMGHIVGPLVEELIEVTAKAVAKKLKEDNVDSVLFVPG